jgi:regulator of protease activity HflC (stomatin/prohibitin superfamily)
VDVKTEKVLLSLGKYLGTLKTPGCYCVNPCCLTVKNVSTAMKAVNLDNVKVADGRGNPLLLSGVVTYRVSNSKQAALDVDNYESFVSTQGTTVMKKVASMYPYEARGTEPSLKSEAEHLRQNLISLLQERVSIAGILVTNFELNDLAYAPEIAQQMLVRQQAEAVVDARKVIALGAVEIVKETIKGLADNGVTMSPEEKARMASNLVVVVCGEGSVNPVMNVGATSLGP